MTLFVVRHAYAGQKKTWVGDDDLRPLSARGIAEAVGVADLIAPSAPERILSSPAVRCLQTVAPLATSLGIGVTEDDRLGQGDDGADAGTVVDELTAVDAVICTHGEVMPTILEKLIADGMEPDQELEWAKGSTWVVERVDGRWGRARYVPPSKHRRARVEQHG